MRFDNRPKSLGFLVTLLLALASYSGAGEQNTADSKETPTLAVEGRIFTPGGVPARGVRLALASIPSMCSPGEQGAEAREVRTDDHGRYRVEISPGVGWRIRYEVVGNRTISGDWAPFLHADRKGPIRPLPWVVTSLEIRNSEDLPLPGIAVRAPGVSLAHDYRLDAETRRTSEPDGRVSFPLAEAEIDRLVFEGYEAIHSERNGRKLVVFVEPLQELGREPVLESKPERVRRSLRVVDENEAAIAGAMVRALDDPRCFAITDARGSVALEVEEIEAPWVVAAPGFHPKLLTEELPQNEAIRLMKVEGVAMRPVLDVADQTLEDVRIRWLATGQETFSDERGRFRFLDLPVNAWVKVRLDKPGFLAIEEDIYTIHIDEIDDVVGHLTLPRPTTVTGRIVTSDGAGVGDLTVTLDSRPDSRSTTETTGRFRFENLPPGNRLLVFQSGEEIMGRLQLKATEAGGVVDFGDVVLAPTIDLWGTVADEEGRPIPEVDVHLDLEGNRNMPVNVYGESVQPIVARSGPAGFFRVEDVPAEQRLSLGFSKSGFTPRAVLATLPGREVEPLEVEMFRLDPVRLRIVSKADRQPLARASIILGHRDYPKGPGRGRDIGGVGRSFYTDESGEVTVEVRGDWTPDLMVQHDEYASLRHRLTREEVEEGEVTLELVAPSEIAGRVLDRSGRPVADVQIHLVQKPGDPSLPPFAGSTRSDSDGRFRLRGLTAGSVTLELTARDRRAERRTVEISPGGTTVDLYLDPPPSVYRLSGEVRFADGEPAHGLGGVPLGVVRRGDGVEWFTVVDPSGAFVFEELPEDEYDLFLQGRRVGRYFRELEGGTIDLREDVDRWVLVVEELPPPEGRGE